MQKTKNLDLFKIKSILNFLNLNSTSKTINKTEYYNSIINIIIGSSVIAICYLSGKYLSTLIHNFLSGSVIGMVLLFFILWSGLIKKEQVRLVAKFLLGNLVFFFIPALVAITLIDFSNIYKSLPYIIIVSIISTIIVMAVTGLFIEKGEKR